MRIGHSEEQSPSTRRRRGFRPVGERLEGRRLLAIDLTNIAGGTTNTQPGPYGVLESGLVSNGGAGFSVAVVGDTNGDGFNDFVIGQPSVILNTDGPAFGNGGNARAYLVFGSEQVQAQTFDYLNLVPQQRIGDIGALGQAIQTNPINGAPGFAFDGLTFTASQNSTSALGGSVAGVGDVNGDGFADFMIGAPGANDSANGLTAAGRAYLVYGGPNLNRQNKLVDFDNPTANSDLNIITFVNNTPNAATGRTVASAGDILPDGLPDIAIGAPNASINGLPSSGAVYVVSGAVLRPARTQTIGLQFTNQGGASNVPGVVFTGGTAGDSAGFAVASAGNFSGATGQASSTLVIGSPQFNVGPGQATVVYADGNLAGQSTVVANFNSIVLNRVGSPVNGINGAIFNGGNNGDRTGASVSTAGDFNADGVGDILIGSPGFNAFAGRVNLIFGRSGAPNPPGPINGVFSLDNLTGINSVEFDGGTPGALAGFSVTATGLINADAINEIAIGSPGFNNNQGVVYLIPGNPDLIGQFNLINTESQPIQGLVIGLSQPANTFNFLGTSVSGVLGSNGAGRTVDGDSVSDLAIGAAGFALNSSRTTAGGGFLLEGQFLPLPNVVSTAITSNIGVESPLPPFSINATAPADLQIFILSGGSNTPGFTPFRDIDPNTLTVNGVGLPDPTTFQQEGDLDGDGIPDASFIFSPRTLLNLANGTVTFTVAARTGPASPTPNRRYTGTTPVAVTGGSNGGGGGSGGLPSSRTGAFSLLGANNQANLPFGERLVPSNLLLRRLRYQNRALAIQVAHAQFLPKTAFRFRNNYFFNPTDNNKLGANSLQKHHDNEGGNGGFTLSRKILTRSKYPVGTFVIRRKRK